VSHENARAILQREHALRCGNIFFKGCLRLLDHADVVAIFHKNVVYASPAGTIRPGAMHENDIPNTVFSGLR
jgi:hypothetical protein